MATFKEYSETGNRTIKVLRAGIRTAGAGLMILGGFLAFTVLATDGRATTLINAIFFYTLGHDFMKIVNNIDRLRGNVVIAGWGALVMGFNFFSKIIGGNIDANTPEDLLSKRAAEVFAKDTILPIWVPLHQLWIKSAAAAMLPDNTVV